jgi:hypothetical protein
VEDQHRRDDPGQVFDLGKSHQEFSFTLRFQQDDDLTPNRHCLDFRAAKPGNCFLHGIDV